LELTGSSLIGPLGYKRSTARSSRDQAHLHGYRRAPKTVNGRGHRKFLAGFIAPPASFAPGHGWPLSGLTPERIANVPDARETLSYPIAEEPAIQKEKTAPGGGFPNITKKRC